MILIVLPAAAVTLPVIAITHFFGQRARVTPPATPDTSILRRELDGRAGNLMPTPAPLAAEPIEIKVHDPSHVGPRAEKVEAQAKAFGGSSVEGLAVASEKHLFIDLPPGTTEAFRRAATENTALDALPRTPAGAPAAGAARDQVEVFIRAAAGDE